MFMLTSAPPSRAATVMARESFENSLPRLASSLPFLCLMVAHLECPDTRTPPPLSAVGGRRDGAARLAGGPRLRRAGRRGRRALAAADHGAAQFVHARVVGKLRMERRDEHPALAGGDDVALAGGEHLDPGPGALDPRRTDEHGAERRGADACDRQVRLEAADLAPEGVAPRHDIHEAERGR